MPSNLKVCVPLRSLRQYCKDRSNNTSPEAQARESLPRCSRFAHNPAHGQDQPGAEPHLVLETHSSPPFCLNHDALVRCCTQWDSARVCPSLLPSPRPSNLSGSAHIWSSRAATMQPASALGMNGTAKLYLINRPGLQHTTHGKFAVRLGGERGSGRCTSSHPASSLVGKIRLD